MTLTEPLAGRRQPSAAGGAGCMGATMPLCVADGLRMLRRHRLGVAVLPQTARHALAMGLLLWLSSLVGCATVPPSNTDDLCAIFVEKRSWYVAAKRSARRWRVPAEVLMATMHQESRFEAQARPPRGRRILGIFPGRRISNAVGYSQALRATWRMYRDSGHARLLNSRSCFTDSVDFIGWYHAQSVRRLGLSPRDAEQLYLAYHEGWGGYERGTWKHRDKRWLHEVAAKVQTRADSYRSQVQRCGKLRRRWFFGLF